MPANDASRSPGRPRGGDSACRGRLLEAAMEAFARSGYDGASLRAIALAADCDVSMVAHYFGSKAELWRAMVDELAQRHQADRAEIARSLAESGVALEARVRRGAGLLFDRIARQAPLARLLMREAAETGERATYVLTQLMQPIWSSTGPCGRRRWTPASWAGAMSWWPTRRWSGRSPR